MRLRKFLLYALGAVGALLGLASLAYVYYRADGPPPNDADMVIVRRQVRDEDNGYVALHLAEGEIQISSIESKKCVLFPDPEDGHSSWDRELARRILGKNESILKRLDAALALPDFQAPPIYFGAPIPFEGYRHLFDLSRIQAEFLFDTGKEKDAFETCLRILRLAQRFECAQGGFLHCNIGLHWKLTGTKLVIHFLGKTCLKPDELLTLFDQLESFRPDHRAWNDFLISAYQGTSLELGRILKGEEKTDFSPYHPMVNNFLTRPNETRSLILERIRIYQKDRWDLRGASFKPLGTVSQGKSAFTPNLLGASLVDLEIDCIDLMFSKICGVDFSISAAQILFALKRYKSLHGDLPVSLEELVPEFLPKIPLDPFDLKPIRYSKEKKIVYSIGEDLIDSGGRDDPSDLKEPSFSIGF